LSNIFVEQIIPGKAKLLVIDPSNEKDDFRDRVKKVFPKIRDIDFSVQDFKKFCMNLETSDALQKLL
jgi:hypothetical protein